MELRPPGRLGRAAVGNECGSPCLSHTDLTPEDALSLTLAMSSPHCSKASPDSLFLMVICPVFATSLHSAAGFPCGVVLAPTQGNEDPAQGKKSLGILQSSYLIHQHAVGSSEPAPSVGLHLGGHRADNSSSQIFTLQFITVARL